MKKIIAMALVLVTVLALVACGGEKAPKVENLTGTMEEVIASINEKHGAVELPLMSMTLDLSDMDGVTYNTGLTAVDGVSEIAISEPMMGQPYSLVLVRTAEGASAEAVAKEMLEKINTRKWVCMEADTKTAAYYGDVAMFFMVSSEFASQTSTEKMVEAFKAVCPGEVTVIG